ncbi:MULTISPECIES: DUF488 family protein [Burkholderiaceae]|jgi:uncharacterized protein (DUF488 family)|uniref:DUF488 domain-containing protein n=2 Tax=Burkholderiaceae TaxID=119060 RepID=B2T002_PARPJ|nr:MULTISPECIES: DUF488 domain-containing protein [Burkholderiaceae]UTP22253.1 DUF488 domain-containing protein [Burkholderia sp. FXe9]ACD14563.1 conserved hypothetical protein [Paraburkholderia phytofirmans PsJN]MBA9947207.1 DUF488 domain-containing protein [Burkholderia cepacia]MBA9977385.1 DUF488 domain-containing protein [Burkholderia cepacia]MBA9996139.1 DUF488 domain-containing protein [Burkholderia cepacia]
MDVATIGFTRKSAETFFGLLRKAEVRTLLDVRLNNVSQLAGFAKKPDLKYFLSELLGARFIELRDLAPEKEMLKRYQKKELSWESYAAEYLELLATRRVETKLDIALFDKGCLLCSEDKPHHCHRRLAVEYLNSQWDNRLKVTHLF